MKEWFKYEYGFVNIDDENLYLTNSGNWTEVASLKEKTGAASVTSYVRQFRIIIFTAVVLAAFAFLFFMNLAQLGVSLVLLVGLPVAGYFLYRYMQSDMSLSFKIPIHKLQGIAIEESTVVLIFTNGAGTTEEKKLVNTEVKGLNILQEHFGHLRSGYEKV